MESVANTIKGPHYNAKLRQWEILWNGDDGSYGGAWGNSEKDVTEKFNKTMKNMKDTPFEIVSKSLKRIDPQDIDDVRMAISGILQDKNRAEVILGKYNADKYMGDVVAIRSITPTEINVILPMECDNWDEGSYLMEYTIRRNLVEDEGELESRCMEYFTEKNNKKLQKEREAAKAKEEEDYRNYLELKKRFEKA